MQLYHYLKLIRIHQPTGIFLLLWPCLWGVALANGVNNLIFIGILILGSVIMRSAGCIINDLIDIDFDKNVARTKDRPLAAGKISKKEASILLFILLALAALILLYLNKTALIIAMSSILLVTLYPFMKRITFWPQLFLGFTFNIGTLLGYAQITGSIELPAVLLYLSGICWTLGYDSIYGFQDIIDDLKIGVKSSSIAIKHHYKFFLTLFYSAMTILLIVSAYLKEAQIWVYLFLTPPILLLYWQIWTLNIDDPKNCLVRFKSNIYVGLLVFGALCLT